MNRVAFKPLPTSRCYSKQISILPKRTSVSHTSFQSYKYASTLNTSVSNSVGISKPGASSINVANSFNFSLGSKRNESYSKVIKEMLVFYKDGIKKIFTNKREAKLLKIKQDNGQELTRGEFQLVSKAFSDSRKLIPFAVLLIFSPESIPFILIFAPGVVPSTCVTENQMKTKIKKVNEKRDALVQSVLATLEDGDHMVTKEDFNTVDGIFQLSRRFGADFQLSAVEKIQLSAYCRLMGLTGFGPKFMLERRLSKHLDYLREDDNYLFKAGISELSLDELRLANEERGMNSVSRDEKQLRQNLQNWIDVHLSADPVVPKGLVVFSRIFRNLPSAQ